MWGETLFNIDEDDYGDYEALIQEEVGNTVQPSEVMYKRFKQFYDSWINKLEESKILMPEFKVSRVRRFVNLEFAKIEENMNYFDNLKEGGVKHTEFHKICNVFLALDTKLTEIEEKVVSMLISR